MEENDKDEGNENQKLVDVKSGEDEKRITEVRNTRDTVEMGEPTFEEEKTCSMKAGSIQGGVFALSSLALGTGCFSIPIKCTQLGLVWYLIVVVIAALAAYWTLTGLIKASRKVNGEDYSPTVKALIGKKPAVFLDLIIIIYLFGVFVQYQVVIYELIGRTLYEFAGDKDLYKDFEAFQEAVWDLAKYKFPIMFGTTLLVSPLCLLKDISKMRFASMFGICALIYCILVVVIQTPWFFKAYLKQYKEDDKSTHANWFDITKGFNNELNIFTGISTIFFCYSCHPGAFPVFKTLKNHTEKRINAVFFRSIGLDLTIYFFIAICGFMTAPLKPKSLIIFRDTVFENDVFMTIAKIALALDLLLSLPANFASYRCSFFMNFFGTDEIDTKRNVLVTIPTLLLSTLIGALYRKILDYISLFGGFCSSIMCYLIPGALMIVTSDEKITSRNNIIKMVIIVLLTTFGFMGAVQTIRSNFTS